MQREGMTEILSKNKTLGLRHLKKTDTWRQNIQNIITFRSAKAIDQSLSYSSKKVVNSKQRRPNIPSNTIMIIWKKKWKEKISIQIINCNHELIYFSQNQFYRQLICLHRSLTSTCKCLDQLIFNCLDMFGKWLTVIMSCLVYFK